MGRALVIGGARSGKTSFAEELAKRWADDTDLDVTYLATAQAIDAEMAERIQRHQRLRPSIWNTIEEPLDIAQKIRALHTPQILLVDCLSILLNNWMFSAGVQEVDFFARMQELTNAITQCTHPIIVVSNEVGQGIVPGDPVSRRYRDWLGLLNQSVAKPMDSVYLVVAGIPVDLKQWREPW